MKYGLIATAAALACAPAFSQTPSVTIYGVMDVAVSHASGDVSSWTAVTSGRLMSSRIGFRGTEDLGGGLAANFVLEADVLADTGTGVTTPLAGWASSDNKTAAATGGLQFNRTSTVGLSGGFGVVTFGRYYTPTFLLDATYDPFGQNGAGISLITGTSAFYTAVGSVNHLRASNMLMYTSPKVGGFTATLAYAPGESPSNLPKDGQHVGAKLGYASGPLSVDVAWGKTKLASVGDLETRSIGGWYDFGVVKPMAEWSEDKLGAAGANGRKRGYMIGAQAPVGAGQFRISLARVSKTSDIAAEGIAKQLSLGYVYNLSKRTAVYATISQIKNQNYVNSGTSGYTIGGAGTSPNGTVLGQDIGIRHIF